jgi:hypothetical protein
MGYPDVCTLQSADVYGRPLLHSQPPTGFHHHIPERCFEHGSASRLKQI